MFSVLVPCDERQPIEQIELSKGESTRGREITSGLWSDPSSDDVRDTLLCRPTASSAGLQASHACQKDRDDSPNIRATRLAMACGLFRYRFYGNVLFTRVSAAGSPRPNDVLHLSDIRVACHTTPDLRKTIRQEMLSTISDDLPDWILNAAQANYHDAAVLAQLAAAMTEDDEMSHGDASSDVTVGVCRRETMPSTFVRAKSPLCIHCRRPASRLCSGCQGVYFCDLPRRCQEEAWSHVCQCPVWKFYTKRREELAAIPLGRWVQELASRPFQVSDQPYRDYLTRTGLLNECKDDDIGCSWWITEKEGWSGGQSESAKRIDITKRVSFQNGFHPMASFPEEAQVSTANWMEIQPERNEFGLFRLSDWSQYYRLRRLDTESPVSLLLTFPLTLYYALVEYGVVPCTVARMMKRALRIHIVGTEKELNFLDLFQETSFLLPDDVSIELVFIVRQDMIPESSSGDRNVEGYSIDLSDRLKVCFVSGTYGDTLDPNFDIGSGPPDMVVAFNAGLFAYESWRSVITFLDHNESVVGVFTDYNEYSGVHCASLGGSRARDSLRVNPFRQPLALPVYSMNLPQMSNGFIYVFNEQELE